MHTFRGHNFPPADAPEGSYWIKPGIPRDDIRIKSGDLWIREIPVASPEEESEFALMEKRLNN